MASSSMAIPFDETDLIDVKTLRGSAKYYKKNGIVRLNFNGDINGTVPNTTWTLLANLPQGYRPPTTVIAHLACDGYGKGNAILRVKSDGDVEAFQSNGGSENSFWGECIFFAGTQMGGVTNRSYTYRTFSERRCA